MPVYEGKSILEQVLYLIGMLLFLGFATERGTELVKKVVGSFWKKVPENFSFILAAVMAFAGVFIFDIDVIKNIAYATDVTWAEKLRLVVSSLLVMASSNKIHDKWFKTQ